MTHAGIHSLPKRNDAYIALYNQYFTNMDHEQSLTSERSCIE